MQKVMIKKICIALIALTITTQAQAGFVTGALVGHALTTEDNVIGGSLLSSATGDTIICTLFSRTNQCYVGRKIKGTYVVSVSVEEFVKDSGYNKLLKQAIFIGNDGERYIVMEVE